MPITASNPPIAYIIRHPYSKLGPASANGKPSGSGVGGVVSHRPSQISGYGAKRREKED
jgi:hypothetical protein